MSSSAPAPSHYLAIDTNVLISRLPLVRELHQLLLRTDMWLLIPTTVVKELDGLKSSVKPLDSVTDMTVGDAARSATTWLLERARGNRIGVTARVRLERWSENAVTRPGGNSADDSILACCLHFRQEAPVSLWTDDRNLALLSESNGVPTVVGKVGLSVLKRALQLELDDGEDAMEIDAMIVDEDERDVPLLWHARSEARSHLSGTRSAPPETQPALPIPTSPSAMVIDPPSPDVPNLTLSTGSGSLVPPSVTNGLRMGFAAGSLAEAIANIDPNLLPPRMRRRHSSFSASDLTPTGNGNGNGNGNGQSTSTSIPPFRHRQQQPALSPTPSAPISRPLPDTVAVQLVSVIGPVLLALAAHGARPPAVSADPVVATATLADQLDDLDRCIPTQPFPADASVPPAQEAPLRDMRRTLAMCMAAARTVNTFLVPGSGKGRTPRSGEAADAVMVLATQLRKLRVAVNEDHWRALADAVRQL